MPSFQRSLSEKPSLSNFKKVKRNIHATIFKGLITAKTLQQYDSIQ